LVYRMTLSPSGICARRRADCFANGRTDLMPVPPPIPKMAFVTGLAFGLMAQSPPPPSLPAGLGAPTNEEDAAPALPSGVGARAGTWANPCGWGTGFCRSLWRDWVSLKRGLARASLVMEHKSRFPSLKRAFNSNATFLRPTPLSVLSVTSSWTVLRTISTLTSRGDAGFWICGKRTPSPSRFPCLTLTQAGRSCHGVLDTLSLSRIFFRKIFGPSLSVATTNI